MNIVEVPLGSLVFYYAEGMSDAVILQTFYTTDQFSGKMILRKENGDIVPINTDKMNLKVWVLMAPDKLMESWATTGTFGSLTLDDLRKFGDRELQHFATLLSHRNIIKIIDEEIDVDYITDKNWKTYFTPLFNHVASGLGLLNEEALEVEIDPAFPHQTAEKTFVLHRRDKFSLKGKYEKIRTQVRSEVLGYIYDYGDHNWIVVTHDINAYTIMRDGKVRDL